MKTQYSIILTIIASIVVAMLVLTYTTNNHAQNDADFWSIYFVRPAQQYNDFVIDNGTDATDFTYTVSSGDTVMHRDSVTVAPAHRTRITLPQNCHIRPITIVVTHDNNDKSLTKK